jgi:hypothetical protein
MYRRSVSSPSSGSKVKPSKKPTEAGGKLNRKLTSRLKTMLAVRFFHVLFVLILDPGDVGDMHLRNVRLFINFAPKTALLTVAIMRRSNPN